MINSHHMVVFAQREARCLIITARLGRGFCSFMEHRFILRFQALSIAQIHAINNSKSTS